MFRVVVCDDEKTALSFYVDLCRKVCAKHGIDIAIKEYDSGSDLMFDLEDPKFHNTLDLLFLDIRMPGLSGVEVAKEARAAGYTGVIIFVTASDEHYSDAFDIGAFHYIKKGDSVSRFEEIFLKAVEMARTINRNEISLSGWGEIRKIRVNSIYYFEVVNRIIIIYYDEEVFQFQGNLSTLEKQLEDAGFLRIHRNYLISLSHVESITFKNVLMTNGKELPVGRTRYSVLKEAVKIMIFH
jgi:DNA-binding LytR/AlgR family response regulator